VVATDRTLGSLAVSEPAALLDERRRAVVGAPITWLRQNHGADVVIVGAPGEHAGAAADAAVTAATGAALVAIAADCAPIALVSDAGVGVVHCGWLGLVRGVIPAAVEALRALGDDDIAAILGPCIEASCYEFGIEDRQRVVDVVGPSVMATTEWGTQALDMVAGVEAALGLVDVTLTARLGGCTACFPDRWYSHRARGDAGRQGLVVWRTAAS
jgi:polyphenol oxidase